MSLDKKPFINRYWSSNILYRSLVRKYKSRNRLQAILTNLHLVNNETVYKSDKSRF